MMRISPAGLMAGVVLLAGPLAAQVGASVTIVNANVATAASLAAVPGFSTAIAEGVLAARPFADQAAFDRHLAAAGLTAEQRAAAYAGVFVQLDLNNTTDAEILMIPGVGNRMLHEFREYAPYRALAQFHREIDKYVDDEELARLEQYVFVQLDLNTAGDEDILSIPGVGSRMLREFKEYRPYRAMAEFDREIGKYVDEAEVARLRRYVTIR
jgi:DNA uptake protein ComE-like DNA-binding protein